MGRKIRLCSLVLALAAGVLGVTVGTASGATFNVACGDVTGLRNAITAANGTPDTDTIEIGPGSPCTFTLTNFSVAAASGNTGLPIVTQPLTINGHGATIQRSTAVGTPLFRLLFTNSARLELNDLVIAGGSLNGSNQAGGGIVSFLGNVVLDRTTVVFNSVAGGGTAGGGGIATIGGELHVDRSTIALNVGPNGGGINTNQTVTEVRRSTFAFNSATASTGAALIQGSTATFENDTFSANVANNNLGGLAIANSGAVPGSATVASSTFADNGRSGNNAPGGALFALANGASATINVTDTIVTDTDSTAAALLAPCASFSISGTATINDNGGNLEWPHNTCGFDTNADPELAALADNGGGTLTYRLEPASPAIDLGGADCPPTDQRSETRPGGDACDTGSFETNPPETTADGPDGPTNDPEITFTSDQEDSTFQCSVDGADAVDCTSPFDPDVTGDGEHTVTVQAINSEGYFDPSPASVTFVLDTTAPLVEITSSPSSPTDDNTPAIEFTVDDDDASVTCQVDDGEAQSCSSPFTTDALADGEHTITVAATDEAGNTGSDSVTFVVDATAPDTTITSGPTGTITSASATFTFVSSEDDSTFECRVDGGDWAACTSPHTVTVAPGTHTFEVRAIDPLDNADPTPASRTWTYQNCTLVRVAFTLFGIPIVLCL